MHEREDIARVMTEGVRIAKQHPDRRGSWDGSGAAGGEAPGQQPAPGAAAAGA